MLQLAVLLSACYLSELEYVSPINSVFRLVCAGLDSFNVKIIDLNISSETVLCKFRILCKSSYLLNIKKHTVPDHMPQLYMCKVLSGLSDGRNCDSQLSRTHVKTF